MPRTILALLDDIFLLPRGQDVARSNGHTLEPISQLGDLGIEEEPVGRPIPLTEPLEGGDAILVGQISAMRPGLILIDATLKSLPWARWIQVLKTSAATRRIPILVFGPHNETSPLARARALGADLVVSRGSFNKRMAALLAELCLPDRSPEITTACEGELSSKAFKGIQLHNKGEYFDAHELFEGAWMEAPEEQGYLYRALLQFTVALLHLERDNPRGAEKMMMRIHQWLDPLPEVCQGVDVAALKSAVAALRQSLREGASSARDLRSNQIKLVS
jgi:predicted metal-dependent hydrolase